jgi:hypothetical protein
MPENIRTADHTWMILNQMPNFQQFFRGYLEILKCNLQQVSVMGRIARNDTGTTPAGRIMIVETQHGRRFNT